jgi:hypothetical protein
MCLFAMDFSICFQKKKNTFNKKTYVRTQKRLGKNHEYVSKGVNLTMSYHYCLLTYDDLTQ